MNVAVINSIAVGFITVIAGGFYCYLFFLVSPVIVSLYSSVTRSIVLVSVDCSHIDQRMQLQIVTTMRTLLVFAVAISTTSGSGEDTEALSYLPLYSFPAILSLRLNTNLRLHSIVYTARQIWAQRCCQKMSELVSIWYCVRKRAWPDWGLGSDARARYVRAIQWRNRIQRRYFEVGHVGCVQYAPNVLHGETFQWGHL